MTFTLREEGGTREGKNEMLSDVGDGGVSKYPGLHVRSLFFY